MMIMMKHQPMVATMSSAAVVLPVADGMEIDVRRHVDCAKTMTTMMIILSALKDLFRKKCPSLPEVAGTSGPTADVVTVGGTETGARRHVDSARPTTTMTIIIRQTALKLHFHLNRKDLTELVRMSAADVSALNANGTEIGARRHVDSATTKIILMIMMIMMIMIIMTMMKRMRIKIMIIMMKMTLVLILTMTVPGLRGTICATSIPGNAVKAAREAKRNQFQDARMKAHTAEPRKDSCAKPTLTSARKHAESARKQERIQNARMNVITAEPIRNSCARTTQINARKHAESARERKRNLFQDVRMKMIIANPIKNSCARTTPTNARKHAESALEMGGKLSSC